MTKGFLYCALLATLCGCEARIQHGLDERAANEIVTVLTERGFAAEKVMEPGKKPTWSIEVDGDQATDAVRILAELGLPRPKSEGFQEVFGNGSLVPSATEERALYLQALSGELARTLESVEGVTAARVHLVLPPPARVGAPPVEAKASAFLRVRPGLAARVESQREELKALLAGSVEGLRTDSVTLVVNEVSTTVAVPEKGPPPAQRLRYLVAGLGLVVSGLSLALVYQTLKVRSQRQAAETGALAARPVLPQLSSRKAA